MQYKSQGGQDRELAKQYMRGYGKATDDKGYGSDKMTLPNQGDVPMKFGSMSGMGRLEKTEKA